MNRQFVELSDLSPTRTANNSYDRPHLGSDHSDGLHEDNSDHLGGDDAFQENDANSQIPILDKDRRKLRRRKAWQDQHQEVRLTKAGRIYRNVMQFSFLARWLIFILPVALLLAIPIIVGVYKPGAEIGDVRILWLFLWIEVVWLALWVSKLFARTLPCRTRSWY